MKESLFICSVCICAGSAWVGDYASNHGCGVTAVAELCDPDDESANRACSDACHYSGCGGGRCVFLPSSSGGASRGCHCR